MAFKATQRLFRRWTEDCDSQLMNLFERYGQSWALLASHLKGRTAQECRKRWLNLSGTLAAEKYESDRQMWLNGHERITLENGQSGWIKVPEINKLPDNPFECIAKELPEFKSSWMKKEAGWSEIELMALREAYEQFILPMKNRNEPEEEINEAWNLIAKKFSRRTGTQCRKFFEKQHIFWNESEKLEKVLKDFAKDDAMETTKAEGQI